MPRRARSSTRSPLFKLPVRQEVGEEIDFHLEMRTREYLEQGMSEEQARAKALARLGDPGRIARDCRRIAQQRDRRWHLGELLSEARMDFVFSLRQMRRSPGFTATVLAVLAIGLAANIAVFSLVSSVLLRPLPFSDPSELVTVWEEQLQRGKTKNVSSPANYLLFQRNSQTLDSMAAFITVDASLTGVDGPAQRARLRLVTRDYFEVLGRAPLLGRPLTSDDVLSDAEPVVVLGQRLFEERYGGRREIVGDTIELNGDRVQVVGVMPGDFELDMGPGVAPYGEPADLFAALPETPEWESSDGRWLMIVGRRRDGVTMEQVESEMQRLSELMLKARPAANSGWTAAAYPLAEHVRESGKSALAALLGAVMLVLLIVCINVASLLTARAATRSGEVAIRAALGAGRARLARQLLNEGLLLSSIATGVGLGLAWLLARLLGTTLPAELVSDTQLLDGRLAGFVVALLGLSTVLFGLLPAVYALRRRTNDLLRSAGSAGPSGTRLRSTLVFAEVALAVVLLFGAGLMLRSLVAQLSIDTGFDEQGVVSFRVTPSRGTPRAQADAFYERLFERLEGVPGVASVGAVTHLPMTSVGAGTSYFPLDRPEPEEGEAPTGTIRVVRGDYFATLGIALLEGRVFDSRDEGGAATGSIVVNRTLADTLWPDRSAVGERLDVHWGDEKGGARTIVGVVADVLHVDPSTPSRGTIYFPQQQEWQSALSVLVKTQGDPASLMPTVRALVQDLDANVPVSDLKSMKSVVRQSTRRDRALALILAVLAGASLLLAAIGVYGVTAYSVAQRKRELGLRVALGASPGEIMGLLLGRAGWMIGGALVVGVGLALLLAPLAQSLLFGVEPWDPLTVAAVASILGVAALVATLAPARRAARIRPAAVLREE